MGLRRVGIISGRTTCTITKTPITTLTAPTSSAVCPQYFPTELMSGQSSYHSSGSGGRPKNYTRSPSLAHSGSSHSPRRRSHVDSVRTGSSRSSGQGDNRGAVEAMKNGSSEPTPRTFRYISQRRDVSQDSLQNAIYKEDKLRDSSLREPLEDIPEDSKRSRRQRFSQLRGYAPRVSCDRDSSWTRGDDHENGRDPRYRPGSPGWSPFESGALYARHPLGSPALSSVEPGAPYASHRPGSLASSSFNHRPLYAGRQPLSVRRPSYSSFPMQRPGEGEGTEDFFARRHIARGRPTGYCAIHD